MKEMKVLLAIIVCLTAFLLGMVTSRVVVVEPMDGGGDAGAALGEKIDALNASMERMAAAVEEVGVHVKTLADETVKSNASSNEAMAGAMSSMPGLG